MLQGFGERNFPLEKYIVDVNKTISPPSHLLWKDEYRLSNGLPATDPEAERWLVEMLCKQGWPSYDDFKLNESQYAAFRAALTKQLVVIQGPPGKIGFGKELQ